MSLFDFTLRPLASVTPWRDPDRPDDLHLSWFVLTDGNYSIDCGKARLFQYTGKMLEYLSERYPNAGSTGDWVDYHVVRLYEDVLELLPQLFSEVPEEVHGFISDVGAYREWRRWLAWTPEIEEDELLDAKYTAAAGWMGDRMLDNMYLVDGPRVWFWLHKGEVFVLWDNEGCIADGIPWWTADAGVCRMPVEHFVSEIESFHDRLMAGMRQRVDEIVAANPFEGVRINIPNLVSEQAEREGSLVRALAAERKQTNWSEVLQAIDFLRKSAQSGGGAVGDRNRRT